MATLVLRLVKGSPLTNSEGDNNLINLNNDIATRLPSASYTAADVFSKIQNGGDLTVVGSVNSISSIIISNQGASGANLRFNGNGPTTPNKFIRAQNGNMEFINSGYANVIATLSDTGDFNNAGILTANNEIRTLASNSYRSIIGNYGTFIRNDGSSVYLMQTNSGDQYGNFNSFRPFAWNLSNGFVAIDSSGSGVSVGGNLTITGATNSQSSISITNGGTAGANFRFVGNGAVTPSKFIRAFNGNLDFLNSAYSSAIMTLADSGALAIDGSSANPSRLLTLTNPGTNGVQIKMSGSGANPTKTIRVLNGNIEVVNDAYSAVIATLYDNGNFQLAGNLITANSFAEVDLALGQSGGYFYGSGAQAGWYKASGASIAWNTSSGDFSTNGSITSGNGMYAVRGGSSAALVVNQTSSANLKIVLQDAGVARGYIAADGTGIGFINAANTAYNMSISDGGNITSRGIVSTAGVLSSGEVQCTNTNSFRSVFGGYGTFMRNDGGACYLLQTASGDAYGNFNSYRPFYWNLGSGNVNIAANGSTTTIGGTLYLQGQFSLDVSALNTTHAFKNTGSNGVQIGLQGNGATTPNKTIRSTNGVFDIVNSAYTASILSITDSGNMSILGNLYVPGALSGATYSGDFYVTGAVNSIQSVIVANGGTNGANIKLSGNGGTAPNKYIRAQGGILQFLNNAYTAPILAIDDSGNLSTNTVGFADGSIQHSSAESYQTGFKNKIIGGDFNTNMWQRGTSFVSPVSGSYTADRWVYLKNGASSHNISKATDSPAASQANVFSGYSLSSTVTTAQGAPAASDFEILAQRIEGNNVISFGFGQAGLRYVTLSFWVRGAKSGIHCVSFQNNGPNRSYVSEYTINTANTWEFKTITIPVDNGGTWNYDILAGLSVIFTLSTGTTFQTTSNSWQSGNFIGTANQVNEQDTVGNVFRIALVQLETGSYVTAFENRSVGQETVLCQRYWEGNLSVNLRSNAPVTGSYIDTTGYFKVSKRVAPTLALTGSPVFTNAQNELIVSSSPECFRYEIQSIGTGDFYLLSRIVQANAEI